MYDQWLWMIFHIPANPTIDLGGIPANQDTFRSIRQFSVIDKVECQVECQERYSRATFLYYSP